jgi:hypothetical protein
MEANKRQPIEYFTKFVMFSGESSMGERRRQVALQSFGLQSKHNITSDRSNSQALLIWICLRMVMLIFNHPFTHPVTSVLSLCCKNSKLLWLKKNKACLFNFSNHWETYFLSFHLAVLHLTFKSLNYFSWYLSIYLYR